VFGIAEVRRRSYQAVARTVGTANEIDRETWRLKTDASSQMDLHNNRIGERIGRVARKVMQDRIYTKSSHPRQAEAFEKVRKHFEHRYPSPTRGGPVQVDAYTRADGTHVTTHSRSAPGRH
jgi:hypothetical protein